MLTVKEGMGRDEAVGSKVIAVSLNQVGAGVRNLSSTSQSLGSFSMAIDSYPVIYRRRN